MNRFEKIVLEQQRGRKDQNFGTAVATAEMNTKLDMYAAEFSSDAFAFRFWYVYGKQAGLNVNRVKSVLPRLTNYGKTSQFAKGAFIYVIDKQYKEKVKGNRVEYWPIYVIPKSVLRNVRVPDTFKVGESPVLTMDQFQQLKNPVTKTGGATINYDDLSTQTITPGQKQDITPVTKTKIDVNNLGKGTKDAKAFQELLWQYGNKNEKIKSRTVYTNFARYRTKGDDGGWDGDIGTNTLKYINALLKGYKLKTYPELIKKIRSDLGHVQNESMNYFKGTGMNIKLKDLLQEQLLKEQEGFDFDAAFGSTPKVKKTVIKKKAPAATVANTKKLIDNGAFNTAGKEYKKLNKADQEEFKKQIDSIGMSVSVDSDGSVTFEKVDPLNAKIAKKIYNDSVTEFVSIINKLKTYVESGPFEAYKASILSGGDDEAAALTDLLAPWIQNNIVPLINTYFNKYIAPYSEMNKITQSMYKINYDLQYADGNDSVKIKNPFYRKIFQNWIILTANTSRQAIANPGMGGKYYNYAKRGSEFTLPAQFYYPKGETIFGDNTRIYYWGANGGRKLITIESDF